MRRPFFRLKDDLGFCSNFSKHPVTIFGKTWPTSEHAYQASKFLDPKIQGWIFAAPTPREAANIGRNPINFIRRDWEDPDPKPLPPAIERLKDRAMYRVVKAKFEQHSDIREQLLATGDDYIVEDTARSGDAYWGETSEGVGLNRLGHIVMLIRSELRNALD